MERDIKTIEKNQFIHYLKFKTKVIVPSLVSELNYEDAKPGYIVSKEADERFKLYLECGLCLHVADEPIACMTCLKNYCRSCVVILIEAKRRIEKTALEGDNEIINKPMICTNRCLISKVGLYLNPEVNGLELRTFGCPNSDCNFSGKWEYLPSHRRSCKQDGTGFKVDTSYWPYIYTQKKEIEYQVQKEFYNYLENQFIEAYRVAEAEQLDSNLKLWNTPPRVTSKALTESTCSRTTDSEFEQVEKVDETQLLEEIIKEKTGKKRVKDDIRIFGYETFIEDSDEDIPAAACIRKVPDKIGRIQFSDFAKVTKVGEPSGKRTNRKKKKKEREREKRKLARNKVAEFLKSRVKVVKLYESDDQLIRTRIKELEDEGITVIAIDVEKMTLKPIGTKMVEIACWVGVTDLTGKVLMNAIIRLPLTAIDKTHEEFHGINKELVKNGTSINAIRKAVFELCKKADRIIMASPEGDFEALKIAAEDYNALLPKIRDIGKLMSGRLKAPLALKFMTYLLFRAEEQNKEHSPIKDCQLTMLSYVYDHKYLERQMQKAKEKYPRPVRKNYLGYEIPPNPKMSDLIKKFSEKHTTWPRRILDRYQRKLINKKVWSSDTFVEPDPEGYPLAERYL